MAKNKSASAATADAYISAIREIDKSHALQLGAARSSLAHKVLEQLDDLNRTRTDLRFTDIVVALRELFQREGIELPQSSSGSL